MGKVTGPSVQQVQPKQTQFESPNGPAPEGPGELHTVEAGDTLWNLAESKLGDAQRWGEIADLNPQVPNPDRLYPGDQLRLPEVGQRKLDDKSVEQKTGLAAQGEVVQNFAEENKGKAPELPKKTGALNLLAQKKELDAQQQKPAAQTVAQQPTEQAIEQKPAEQVVEPRPGDLPVDKPSSPVVDASMTAAIDQLKKTPQPISGEAMKTCIVDGSKDLDNAAASTEYQQLAGFAKNNWDKLSPDAKATFRVYSNAAKKAHKEGLTGIPTDRYDKMVADMGKAGYLDETAGAAVENLREHKKPISGEAMHQAITDVEGDTDPALARNCHKDLKRFVGRNMDKLSPEAQAKWQVYDDFMKKAPKGEGASISDDSWQKMMDGLGAPDAAPATKGALPVDKPSTKPSEPPVDPKAALAELQQQADAVGANDRFLSLAQRVLDPSSEGGKAITGKEAREIVDNLKSVPAKEQAALKDNFLYALQNNGIALRPEAHATLSAFLGVKPDALPPAVPKPGAPVAQDSAPVDKPSTKPSVEPSQSQGLDPNFDWGNVPVDARSPELQQAIGELMAQAQGAPAQPLAEQQAIQQMMQAQQDMAAQMNGQVPSQLDPESAMLAQQMGMKPPLSFEDQMFLMQMKYAANQEQEILQQMNALAGGQGAAPQGPGQQSPSATPGYNPAAQSNPAASQMSPEMMQYMQQMAQQQAAIAQGQPGAQLPPSPIGEQAQQDVEQVMMNLQGAIQAFEDPNSEGGEMIALGEMQQLISIARQLPPEMQQALKAEAYQAAVQEGGLTPEAFQALMTYVNEAPGQTPTQTRPGELPVDKPVDSTQQAEGDDEQQARFDPAAEAATLRKAVRGFGTDEDAIFKALDGKTPEQAQAIRQAYQDMYGRDLEADLKGDLSGADERRALAMLNGDAVQADVEALRKAMDGNYGVKLGTDEDAIFKTLEGKSPEHLAAVQQAYQDATGKPLQHDLTSELSGAELKRANEGLQGNNAGAAAMALNQAMKGNDGLKMGTDEEGLFKALESVPPGAMPAVSQEYMRLTGRDLATDLKGELSGQDEARAMALMQGDRASADASVLYKAMKGNYGFKPGTDEDTLFKLLEGSNRQQRGEILQAYQQAYNRDLIEDLRSELSFGDEDRALKALFAQD
ncbi:MAG: LysM peptidoglycan-binding domain-containing protein [Pseudomonadota bacterium]